VINLTAGMTIERDHLTVLRPCPADALPPYNLEKLIGKKIQHDVQKGEHLRWINIE